MHLVSKIKKYLKLISVLEWILLYLQTSLYKWIWKIQIF